MKREKDVPTKTSFKKLRQTIVDRLQHYKGKIGVDIAVSIVNQECDDTAKKLKEEMEHAEKTLHRGKEDESPTLMAWASGRITLIKEFLEALQK